MVSSERNAERKMKQNRKEGEGVIKHKWGIVFVKGESRTHRGWVLSNARLGAVVKHSLCSEEKGNVNFWYAVLVESVLSNARINAVK